MLCHSYSVSILLLVLLHIRCTSQSVGAPETNEQVQLIEPINEQKSDGKNGAGIATTNKHKQKLGQGQIEEHGEVAYNPTNARMGAIQLGIANSIEYQENKKKQDVLVKDFQVIEKLSFPSYGSKRTPSHAFGYFRFDTYAPNAFRYFRELYNINPTDFIESLCKQPLKEFSSPGASGSLFYVSNDDKFIIKTVQKSEADFLQTLLDGYFLNVHQNPKTFLPKFFGLFAYQSVGKTIRLVVMNNLLPTSIVMHHKFDLKGSTLNRTASETERDKILLKQTPTLKDLDFNKEFENGIILDAHTHDNLMNVIERDVRDSISVTDPKTYAERFQKYISVNVFRKAPVNTTATHIPTHITTSKAEESPLTNMLKTESIPIKPNPSQSNPIMSKTERTKPLKILAIKKQKGEERQPKTVHAHEGTQKQGCKIEEKEDHIICINGTESYGTLNYAQDRKDSEAILISKVDVVINKRRQGVGTAMLNYFIEEIAKKRGYKKIKLIVIRGRENVVEANFYKKAGFKFVNNITNYTNLMALQLPETQSIDRPHSLEKDRTNKDSEESGSSKENSTGK